MILRGSVPWHGEISLIDISDPVYTFCEVADHLDLTPYFVDDKDYRTGRPRCDAQKLLKVILFAFMERGISSLRDIEKLCRNDIRFMYLLLNLDTSRFVTGRGYRKTLHQRQYQEICEEHGMKKFMKFTMFEKETKNEKYHINPYRAVNFKRDSQGNLICPNKKKVHFF